jgi:hypothetical protein
MVMVRAGHIRFIQAKRLNGLGQFFHASINLTLGALWDYVHEALNNGNSAISLGEARHWLRMQDGFENDAIDEAFAAVGERIDPAAALLGEHNHKLVYVGDPCNGMVAFQEVEHIEARLLTCVKELNEPIAFEANPFQDERFGKRRRSVFRCAYGFNVSRFDHYGRAGDRQNLHYERDRYAIARRNGRLRGRRDRRYNLSPRRTCRGKGRQHRGAYIRAIQVPLLQPAET